MEKNSIKVGLAICMLAGFLGACSDDPTQPVIEQGSLIVSTPVTDPAVNHGWLVIDDGPAQQYPMVRQDDILESALITVSAGTHNFRVNAVDAHESTLATGSDDETIPAASDTVSIQILTTPVWPDLIVDDLSHLPTAPTVADTISFFATVRNTGTGGAGTSQMRMKIGGESSPPTMLIPALAPGDTFLVVRKMLLPIALSYLVRAEVDVSSEIPESDESNNEAQVIIEVVPTPPPDLVVSSLTHSPENPNVADLITFTAVVTNNGPGDAGPSNVSLKVGGESVVPTYPVPALAVGESHQITRQVTLPIALTYLIRAYADPDNDIAEQDETNNEAQLILRVVPSPRPDLVVSSLTHSPENPDVTDLITFTAVVTNNGPGDAEPSTVSLKIGGESAGLTYHVPALAVGESHQITRQTTLPIALTYLIVAYADPNSDITEQDETNNETTDIVAVHSF